MNDGVHQGFTECLVHRRFIIPLIVGKTKWYLDVTEELLNRQAIEIVEVSRSGASWRYSINPLGWGSASWQFPVVQEIVADYFVNRTNPTEPCSSGSR